MKTLKATGSGRCPKRIHDVRDFLDRRKRVDAIPCAHEAPSRTHESPLGLLRPSHLTWYSTLPLRRGDSYEGPPSDPPHMTPSYDGRPFAVAHRVSHRESRLCRGEISRSSPTAGANRRCAGRLGSSQWSFILSHCPIDRLRHLASQARVLSCPRTSRLRSLVTL